MVWRRISRCLSRSRPAVRSAGSAPALPIARAVKYRSDRSDDGQQCRGPLDDRPKRVAGFCNASGISIGIQARPGLRRGAGFGRRKVAGGRARAAVAKLRHGRGGTDAELLPGKLLDATDRGFEGLLRSPDVVGFRMRELLLELVAGEIVNGLPHMLRAVLHGLDHASDDEGKLDLVEGRIRLFLLARYQILRTHRVRCVPVGMGED